MADGDKERWRAWVNSTLEAATKDAADRVKNQLAIAQEALKALLLANGGAMIALFTFIGNVLSRSAAVQFNASFLRWAFMAFVAGFVVDLLAYVLAFLSQDRFYYTTMAEVERLSRSILTDTVDTDQSAEIKHHRSGQRFYIVGLGLAVISVLCFATGCGFALAGVLVR